MSDQQPTFAEAFERLRIGRGWTPAQVARELGVYPTEVSRWRHGRGGISINNVRKVAALFAVDPTWLEGLAGYGASNSSGALDTLDAEHQMWRARYEYLIEKKVPHWAREAYIAACEALAEAYHQMRPGQLNSVESPSLNASPVENNSGEPEPDSGRLGANYRPLRSTYRSATLSVAPAR